MHSPAFTRGLSQVKRFFIRLPDGQSFAGVSLQQNSEFLLEDAERLHYLKTVLRLKGGEPVILVNEEKPESVLATVTRLERRSAVFSITQPLPAVADGLPDVVLACALIKEHRWEWLIQKTVELGVRRIQPLLTERCVIQLKLAEYARKQVRWQAIARAAAEQSEGLFIPAILLPSSLSGYLSNLDAVADRFLLQERGEARLPFAEAVQSCLQAARSVRTLHLALGPEGGWTDAEICQFKEAGFMGTSLGGRVLRAETAAMTAMGTIVALSDAGPS